MNLAFISDIHSNLEGLEKVIKKMEDFSIDKIYCLGDIVGYGDNPNEVIELLKLNNIYCIKGNHDDMLINGSLEEKYNFPFTQKIITVESMNFLANLQDNIILIEEDAILSHAVPFSSNIYLYSNSDFTILDSVNYKYIFMGHTHYPMLMSYYDKKVINPGSVGQPRDSNSKSSFLICDMKDERFEFIRI